MEEIEKYRALIKMIDSRKAISPGMEPLVLKAYRDIFGDDENVKAWESCRCPGYSKLFYSQLKLKLNEHDRQKQM